jgi:ABC-type multidrug transport system fused ATPase/permease subunit
VSNSPSSKYRDRSSEFRSEAEQLSRYDRPMTIARTATFVIGAGCLFLSAFDANLRGIWIASGTTFILAFLALVFYHDSIQRRRDRLLQLTEVNLQQLARTQRRWDAIPSKSVEVPRQHLAVAKDLDLIGRASVFQLVNLAHTPRGIEMLRDWILEPASPEDILNRQTSVQVLAPEFDLREELVLRGRMLAAGLAGPEAFTNWAEAKPFSDRHPWLKWIALALPIVSVSSLLAFFFDWGDPQIAGVVFMVSLLINVLFSVLFTGEIHDIFNNISSRSGEMRHYLALFELLAKMPTGSPELEAIQQHAVREEHGALRQLVRLGHIMKLANLRHASLLSILYFGLQALVLWDFHVLQLLEWWQRRCGHLVRQWFDALGELEALCSLSCLAHDNPDWCYPRVSRDGPDRLTGKALAHPLLSDTVRVANDVEVGPTGTVLLVTGSNMSGKSTLLRAIGVNAVLAEAGAPVCASQLSMCPVTVTTSMRIQDSLEDGVSFYMAELKRLKAIVDQAESYQSQSERTLLYLLDEILQGTNSVERHIAVARVLSHLVEKGAIGAVSTHDLDLATSPDLAGVSQAVHFRETLHDADAAQQMTFDYRLRPGVATTTNALKLLELVGLDRPDQDSPESSE